MTTPANRAQEGDASLLPSETVPVPTAWLPSEPETLATSPPLAGPAPQGESIPSVTVPGYEVLGLLGRGGMGVVYKARQVQADRLVALKMILHAEHAGAVERARFQAEAQAVARLQHPNIVQVYEVGEHRGIPFFSLEFCAGGSLDQKLAGTPLKAKPAAALIEKLARAMQAAHQAHIIHRDLSPANVLFTAQGEPKITDFGLAKRLDEQGQTQTGTVMGTPSYMAPEQAGGQSKAVGPAADIYALGAILYECLTGRPPFKAATVMDTLKQVVSEEPVPPSQLQSKTPKDLETICLKCLDKESAKRYATAAALADDLGRFQRGEPIVARPVGRLERGWRWCRRQPALATALAAVAASLLGGSLVATLFAVQANEAKKLAEQKLLAWHRDYSMRVQANEAMKQVERRAEAEAKKTTDPAALALLAKILSSSAARMEAKEAAALCGQAAAILSQAMTKTTDPKALAQLAQGLSAVLCREAFWSKGSPRYGLIAALGTLTDPGALLLAPALLQPALEPPLPPLPAQTLVDLLKQPFCAGEAHKLVLEQLSRHYQRPFANQGDFFRFATEQKLALDLTSPPKRPETADAAAKP